MLLVKNDICLPYRVKVRKKKVMGRRFSRQSNVSLQLRSRGRSHFQAKCATEDCYGPRYLTLLGGGFPSRVLLVGGLMVKASRNQSCEQKQFPENKSFRCRLRLISSDFCLDNYNNIDD